MPLPLNPRSQQIEKFLYAHFNHKVNNFDTTPTNSFASDSRLQLNTYALEHCDLSKADSEKSTRPFSNKYLSGEIATSTCYRDCYSPLDVAHRLAVAGSLRAASVIFVLAVQLLIEYRL
ncbi:hypothetical protein Tco_1068470 [Tanacetum coccineum]|uniref:Uncharacterized protein n=1 Tax=Tanacetum coccineum TaxID=301880 RepID=A0ABQ5HI12_9ASTR